MYLKDHNTSLKANAPLVALILQQSNVYCTESKDTKSKQRLMLAKLVSSGRHDAVKLMEHKKGPPSLQ